MQIESFVLSNLQDEILFSCNALKAPQTWDNYLDMVTKRIQMKTKVRPQIYVFDDIVIAVRDTKNLRYMITAPASSMIKVGEIIHTALDQFEKIVNFVCNGDPDQEKVIERDNYIKLQMIIQQELSPSGFMRMIPESEFEAAADF